MSTEKFLKELEGGITLSLNTDELLLLDWVLLHPLSTYGLDNLDATMKWHSIRYQVWHCLYWLDGLQTTIPRISVALLGLSYSEAELLLALVPTTHRWGVDKDCGYTLKLKLYKALSGEDNDIDITCAEASEKAPPNDSTTTQTQSYFA